ncbi:BspA family leucine-rich repeat surface protein [Anaerovorax odorimutans]|uniref:BspA family leucine-rich repeat surface protein n=2 Tax=Anaerovorax odorimutans TaxID=109327 RepID=A0ABT1RJ65_9FIRM|nr:BspA family leucine-rich repeat surface protein [Anaerovorax odorimutans]
MSGWFEDCYNLSYFDGSRIDCSKLTDLSFMFSGAGKNSDSFRAEGISNWDMKSVRSVKRMFCSAGGSRVQHIDIGGLTIPGGCTMDEFAYSCRALNGTITLEGAPAYTADAFYHGVTLEGNRVLLSFSSAAAEASVDELVAQYGRHGTRSQGYIYKNAIDVVAPENISFGQTSSEDPIHLSARAQLENRGIPAKISQVAFVPGDGWTAVPQSTDFARLPIDSKKVGVSYKDKDLTNSYVESLIMDFDGTASLDFKASIGPVGSQLEGAAFGNIVLTLEKAD